MSLLLSDKHESHLKFEDKRQAELADLKRMADAPVPNGTVDMLVNDKAFLMVVHASRFYNHHIIDAAPISRLTDMQTLQIQQTREDRGYGHEI